MKAVIIALVIALVASAGACWFYLGVAESEVRQRYDDVLQSSAERAELDDFVRDSREVFDEHWPVAVADVRTWTWRHVYPRLVVFTFLCAVATSLLAQRRATAEAQAL